MLAFLLSLLGLMGLSGGSRSQIATVGDTASSTFDKSTSSDDEPNDETVVVEDEPAEVVVTTPSEPQEEVVVVDVEEEPSEETPVQEVEEPLVAEEEITERAPIKVLEEVAAGDDLSVMTGRVTSIEISDANVADIKITSGPEHGNLTVNADNTLSLVLSETDYLGQMNFGYEVTYENGSTEQFTMELDVVEGAQAGGWGLGEYYMLETDDEGDLVIEHGDNHRDVYISKSDAALTVDDIAALEGLEPDEITTKWLLDNPEYGGSETLALEAGVGMEVWFASTNGAQEPTSNWLHLERGFDYTETGRLIGRDSDGESELHPMVVTSWGEGEKPVIHEAMNIYQDNSQNVVVTDVAFDARIQVLNGDNILLDNLSVSNSELNIQNVNNFTLRDSDVADAHHEQSLNSEEIWGPAPNRISGIFITKSEGVLIENSLFDHNGWEDDYLYDLGTEGGQPPSLYSHNVYIQYSNTDVTFRDNIVMRGASFGAQIRSGGLVEDNVFIDNNGGFAVLGGDYKDRGPEGEYALVTDNLTTSAAHKTVDRSEGALSIGNVDQSELATWLDNIVTHLADPNNLDEELAYKVTSHDAYRVEDEQFYDNTIIYGWLGQQAYTNLEIGKGIRNPDENIDGLDTDVLDQTTIQNFAAILLDNPDASIEDLANHLRDQYGGQLEGDVTADDILAYFQSSFGLSETLDDSATTLTFAPDSLGEGMRWDNRLNWDKDYIPTDGQNIDLNDNWVYYSGTTRVDDFDFGDGGKLHVGNGYLGVEGDLSVGEGGAEITLDGAGQFWTDGYSDSDRLVVDADGGRFANTGDFTGTANLSFEDNAQGILATGGGQFDLTADSELTITGGDAKVGFDGETGGVATLRLDGDSTLNFEASDGELGAITEFRSGAFGDDTNVDSGVHLGDSTLSLDLNGIDGDYSKVLIEADLLVGTFDAINVVGLGGDRDASLTIDYSSDSVVIDITSGGSGDFNFNVVGEANDGDAADIWNALTDGQGTYSDGVPEAEFDGEDPFLDVA